MGVLDVAGRQEWFSAKTYTIQECLFWKKSKIFQSIAIHLVELELHGSYYFVAFVSSILVEPVKIRPRKACRYPNLRSFGWVSYDKVGGLYSGKLGIRSEARASDLRSYPGLCLVETNKAMSLRRNESEYSPRTCSIGRPAGGTLCPPPLI